MTNVRVQDMDLLPLRHLNNRNPALLSRVAPLRRLRRPCWSAEEAWELTGRFRRPLTSIGDRHEGQANLRHLLDRDHSWTSFLHSFS